MLPARSYFAYRVISHKFIRAASIGLASSMLLLTNAALPASAASAPPLDPSGLWSTKDDESIIRIAPCTTPPAYCGTIVWLKEPLEKGVPKTDSDNPDPEKRSRPILGLDILTELVPDNDHWKGKAYNSDDGKTYDITFKVLPDKEKGDKGQITGCVLRILCQSETFVKVQSIPGADPAAANAAHPTPAKTPPAPPPPHTH